MLKRYTSSTFARLREIFGPYAELATYLRPYRVIFIIGTLCGVGFGVVSGSIPFLLNFVGKVVFSGAAETDITTQMNSIGPMAAPISYLALHVFHFDHVSKQFLVVVACLLIPGMMMIRSLLDFLNCYCSEWVSQKVLIDIREKLMEHITSLSLDYFNESRAGNLLQRIINETREVQSVLTTISTQLISQPATLIAGLFVLIKIDWRFTIGALILFPCVIGPLLYLGKKIRQSSHNEDAQRGEMMVILHEMLAGIKVIKSFSRTKYELERFNDSSQTQFHQIMRFRRIMETTTPVVESLAAIGVAIGLFYVYSTGTSGSTFLALCVGIFLLYQPIKILSKLHLTLLRSKVVIVNVFDLMRRVPSVTDAPDATVLGKCHGGIEFENVTFAYRHGVTALDDFSFRFEPGKYYALVGASGAGKSTLLSLIMRFYDPNCGSVRIDGKDLRSVTQDSLREQIGIVTQDTFLFHDSIYKNIAYGRLEATREEVIDAAKQAHAHEFILAQQNGYDTVVGDKGCMLSGGQQQRIAIARTLLKNAPVLLLDEATSALDSASEKQIQAALEALASGRTVIAIAHRLSTILKADKILVLESGRLEEVGTHAELLDKAGIYKKLYTIQFNQNPHSKTPMPVEVTHAG